MSRKILIESSAEGGIIPLDFCSEVIEFDDIFGDVMVFLHDKVFDHGFSFSFQVIRSKIFAEFFGKEVIAIKPKRHGLE